MPIKPIKMQLPDGVPPLTTYYIYMAGSCNLACRHCWITPSFLAVSDVDSGENSLPFELFELAISEGEPLGLKHMKFTGGEPFVHPQIEHMLAYAVERQLGVSIETNGTLITAERARFLREKTSLTFISVSLDGATAVTHDFMRGVAGSFVRAQAGIKHLVDAGIHPQIIMSLYEGNLDEIEPLAQWVASAGCASLKLNIIQDIGRGSRFTERLQGIERLLELGRQVEKDMQNRVSIPIHYSWPPSFKSLRYLANGGGGDSCNIHNILGILHTGHISMCGIGQQVDELVYGLLGKDSVAEIWTKNDIIQKIRESIPYQLEGVCGDCMLRDTCMGFCPATNYYRTKNLNSPFWYCALADEAGLFPTSRKRQAKHI